MGKVESQKVGSIFGSTSLIGKLQRKKISGEQSTQKSEVPRNTELLKGKVCFPQHQTLTEDGKFPLKKKAQPTFGFQEGKADAVSMI